MHRNGPDQGHRRTVDTADHSILFHQFWDTASLTNTSLTLFQGPPWHCTSLTLRTVIMSECRSGPQQIILCLFKSQSLASSTSTSASSHIHHHKIFFHTYTKDDQLYLKATQPPIWPIWTTYSRNSKHRWGLISSITTAKKKNRNSLCRNPSQQKTNRLIIADLYVTLFCSWETYPCFCLLED